ncbi:MAG: 30S ribosome-binding factor RbfA [Candidatus Limnocylindrales bacterium]
MTQRTDRIDELLRQEIGQALEREVTDPGIGFVTVTKVETSPDLAHARVWVSVIGSEERRKEALAGLRRAMPYIRRGLGSKIRLRRIPELDVRLDDTLVRGTRVLQIINELEAGRIPEDVPETGESLPTPVARLPHEGDVVPDEVAPQAGPTPRKKRAWRPDRGPDRGSAGASERDRGGPGPGARPTRGSSSRRPR